MKRQVKAQLHASPSRSSKALKDPTRIETVVEVAGVGRLVLDVDSAGGYSLRAYPEGSEAPSEALMCKASFLFLIHPSACKVSSAESAVAIAARLATLLEAESRPQADFLLHSSVVLLTDAMRKVGNEVVLVLPSEHERCRRSHPKRCEEHQ
jgi:NAD-dependent oxidoreductase involved in siderophore biosynthesis